MYKEQDMTDILEQLSDALGARADAAKPGIVAIHGRHGHLTGLLWANDLVATSEQALGQRDEYEITGPNGESLKATPAGRDKGTNVALLKLATPLSAPALAPAAAKIGAVAVAIGADGKGGVSARFGIVNRAGEAWHSRAGGRIDARVVLDMQLGRSEEGAPVFDAGGGFLGMSTLGPWRRAIVIPAATLARVIPALLKDGHIPRGWLGMALQPVAVPETLRDAAGQTSALMVMSVAVDGPAAKAGFLAGDIVLAIGDVHGFRGMRGLLNDSIGKSLDIRFIRGGEIRNAPLVVTARPEKE
jgi:S1-C subfamily serine protease